MSHLASEVSRANNTSKTAAQDFKTSQRGPVCTVCCEIMSHSNNQAPALSRWFGANLLPLSKMDAQTLTQLHMIPDTRQLSECSPSHVNMKNTWCMKGTHAVAPPRGSTVPHLRRRPPA